MQSCDIHCGWDVSQGSPGSHSIASPWIATCEPSSPPVNVPLATPSPENLYVNWVFLISRTALYKTSSPFSFVKDFTGFTKEAPLRVSSNTKNSLFPGSTVKVTTSPSIVLVAEKLFFVETPGLAGGGGKPLVAVNALPTVIPFKKFINLVKIPGLLSSTPVTAPVIISPNRLSVSTPLLFNSIILSKETSNFLYLQIAFLLVSTAKSKVLEGA